MIGHMYEAPPGSASDAHRRALTVRPEVPPMFAPEDPSELEFPLFEEDQTDGSIIVPLMYGLKHFGPAPHRRDVRPAQPPAPEYRFEGQLNSQLQVEALNAATVAFRDGPGSGILSLYCGCGKTVVALRLLSKLGVPTLVLVHKEFLMNQWRERIQQFLPDASVGTVRGPKLDLARPDGRPHEIVLGMLQTVATHDYGGQDVFAGFGLTVIDEVHHVAARVFSQAVRRASSRFNLGLSATPRRADGLTKVLHWFLGPVLYAAKRPPEPVEVRVVEYHDRAQREVSGRKGPNVAIMTNLVVAMRERNCLLLDLLEAELQQGRRVIALSDRVEHLRVLEAGLRERRPEARCGFYVGGMKAAEREASNDADVVFATFAMASEGYDNAGLNTVLLASPKSSVEQSVGRILRGGAEERTLTPRVLDVADQYSAFLKYAERRLRLYERMEYSVAREARYCDSRKRPHE